MSLTPWVERDPFHKEADFVSLNLIQPPVKDTFTGTSTGQLDFDTEAPLLVTARPKHSTTTSVDNKLDIPTTTTTNRPKKKRTTTRRPTAIVDNKIDFSHKESPTKRPTDSPFSKLRKDSKNVQKRSTTAKKLKRPTRAVDDGTDDLTGRFLNQDNATKYMNNKAISPRFETQGAESRLGFETNYDNDFDHGDTPYRPTYEYSFRPDSYPPQTTKRPVSYQNNRPNYQNTNFVNIPGSSRPTDTPISVKYSTPFSYDTYRPSGSMSPQINYDNMAIPLYISPNRPTYSQSNYKRPTYATTRKMGLSTFLVVETTRRTTTPNFVDLKRTTQRPFLSTFLDDYQNSFSSQSPVFVYRPSSSSSLDDSTNFSILSSSNTNEISIKRPPHVNPFNDFKPPSVFSSDADDDDDAFDGYLRPETSFYIPLRDKHKPSYNDYSKYNNKPEASTANNVKYFYIENVLHKYYEGKSNGGGLYDRQQTKRYAEFYDEHLNDKSSNEFVSLARTLTDKKTNDEDASRKKDRTLTLKLDGRAKNGPQNIFLVPFTLLTKIERPDNWVVKTTDQDMKSQLLEVPALEQDGSVARELPKPIFGRLK